MKRTLFTALLGAMALALPLVRAAADESGGGSVGDPGFAYYEERATKILRSAGDKVWEAAEYAKRMNLFQFAKEQAERAIGFDPDHADAREYLCFVKKKKKWVRDEEAWEKLRKQNTRSSGQGGKQMSEESFEALMEKWKDERLAKANKFVAAKYAVLGADCAKHGFPLQAKKGYEYALRLDKDNAKARKGLGYKKFGRVWLSRKQDEARKKAAVGKQLKEASDMDQFFGVTLNKVVSEHFRLESPFPTAELIDYIKTCEIAYAYYLADLDIDPTRDVFGRRGRYILMETEEQWNKFVDAYAGSEKEFTRKTSGTGSAATLFHGKRNKDTHTPELRKDGLVHTTIHWLNHKVFRQGGRAWINEGMAYYYTVKVLSTTMTYCVALKTDPMYGGQKKKRGGMKDWQDPDNWKPKLKEMVQAKDDIELRTLVNKPITDLDFKASVKSWGIITWMMDTDRDKYIAMLHRLKSNPGDQIGSIEAVWGKGLEELDKDWRKYVIRNF